MITALLHSGHFFQKLFSWIPAHFAELHLHSLKIIGDATPGKKFAVTTIGGCSVKIAILKISTLAQVERFVGMLERHPEMVWTVDILGKG